MSASKNQSASTDQRASTDQSETDTPPPTTPPERTPNRLRPRIAAPPQPHEGGWLRDGLQRSDLLSELSCQTPAGVGLRPDPTTHPSATSTPPTASQSTSDAAADAPAAAPPPNDPQLPPQAQHDVALARQEGRGVFFRAVPPAGAGLRPAPTACPNCGGLPARCPNCGGLPAKCPNCGGLGRVILQIVLSGPHPSPTGHGAVTWIDGSWYTVETRSYPCPACQDPQLRQAELWHLSGLEAAERGWTLDFLDGLPSKEIAVESARALISQCPSPRGWLTYYGGYGTGKSGLLKSIVAACIRQEVSAHYTRAEDILQRLRASFNNEAPSESRQLEQYAACQVLAIDEIDRTSGSAWARATLLTLLDGRYNRRGVQATLLASNVPPEGMPRELGYLASRMKDGERVLVGGREMRGR